MAVAHNKAYRIRFTPTHAQAKLLWRWFGAARFAYNFALSFISGAWRQRRESKSYADAGRELTRMKSTEAFGWLKEIPSDVLAQPRRNLDRAFANFFGKRARYPRRKKFGTVNTVRFALDPRHAGKMRHWAAGKLELPALGVLDLARALPNCAPPKMVTVRLEPCGKWSVSFCVQEEIEVLPVVTGVVGIDLGVSSAIVLSTGEKVANGRRLAGRMKYIKRQQRRLSRKVKGSNRWRRQKYVVACAHAKLAGMRRDFAHQQANRLIAENQIIVTEDLNIAGMMRRGGGLAREMSDVGMGGLVSKIAYKAEWRGRTHIKVDRFFPSSKTCSGCQHKLDELRLDVRKWACPKCGTQHDRDVNAARNILAEGLRILVPATGPGIYARGEGSAGGRDGTAQPVPLDEARTGQIERACLEQAREI